MTTTGLRRRRQLVEQLGGDPQRDEDQPVGVAAVERCATTSIWSAGSLPVDEMTRRNAGAAEHVGDGVHHRDVHRVADVGDGEGDLLGAPDLERAGDGVGHVVELGGGLLDTLRARRPTWPGR